MTNARSRSAASASACCSIPNRQEGSTRWRIARVMRDGAGHYVYDPLFIPPCVQVSASERLLLMVRQLLEILEQKSATLGGGGRQVRRVFRARTGFLLAAAFGKFGDRGAPPSLDLQTRTSRRGLPGAFAAGRRAVHLRLESHPRTLPVYDHDDLTGCFAALEQHIRTHLEIILPTKCLQIHLQQTANYFYEGEVTDARCLGRARWVFGIHSDAGEAEVIQRSPATGKSLFQQVRRRIGEAGASPDWN